MSKHLIRPVIPQDLPDLKTIIDQNELFPSDMLDDMITGYFADNEEGGSWLTCDDGKPVGLVYYTAEPMTEGTYNALLLAVRPDAQGKGVGRALMEHVEQTLKEEGKRILLVETSSLDAFEGTRTFYRRIGYEEEARIRAFYAEGEDKIVFRKAL